MVICTIAHDDVILLGREEEECVTAEKLKQAESPVCTENRTHLHISCSSTFHDFATQCYPCISTRCDCSKPTWWVVAWPFMTR